MADAPISQKPAAAPLTGAEQGVAVQLGQTVRFSLQDLPVSILQQEALDLKASTDVATQSVNGLMSAADKTALDELNFPPATNDPATIGELSLELTSDTTLTIKVRGSDNVVRSIALTLA